MLHFVVTYDTQHVTAVDEFPTLAGANAKCDELQQKGSSATVYSAKDKSALGIRVGDTRPQDLSDEMDFKGFGKS